MTITLSAAFAAVIISLTLFAFVSLLLATYSTVVATRRTAQRDRARNAAVRAQARQGQAERRLAEWQRYAGDLERRYGPQMRAEQVTALLPAIAATAAANGKAEYEPYGSIP